MDVPDRWSLALLALAAYVAVMILTRLMIRRRNRLIDEFRGKMAALQAAEEAKKKAAQRAQKKADERGKRAA